MRKIFSKKTIFLSILFFSFFAMAQSAEAMVFPGADWQTATPQSQNINLDKFQLALDYLYSQMPANGARLNETMIVRNGYVIWQGSDINNDHKIYSASKTFVGAMAGIMIKEGRFQKEDDALDYWPVLDDVYEDYGWIKIKHLMTMTSGYDEADDSYDVLAPLFLAGTKFNYSNDSIGLLDRIMGGMVGGDAMTKIFKAKIANEIGMTTFSPSDYSTSASDLARFGLLYLNDGNWDGKQILDADFVQAAGANQVPASLPYLGSDGAGHYGYFWWTNGENRSGNRSWPDAPPQTYTAQGSYFNWCFVVPEWQMVIVRLDANEVDIDGYSGAADVIWNEFFRRLSLAINNNDIIAPTAPSGLSVN